MDVMLIGYGAIAREVLKRIEPGEPANISAILVREARVEEVRRGRYGPGHTGRILAGRTCLQARTLR